MTWDELTATYTWKEILNMCNQVLSEKDKRLQKVGKECFKIYAKRPKYNGGGYWYHRIDTAYYWDKCIKWAKEGECELRIEKRTLHKTDVSMIGRTIFFTKEEAKAKINEVLTQCNTN